MSDVFTKTKRSEVMSRICGRGNRDTELALVKLLRLHGITGWRRHPAVLGKPDFIFQKERVALFVDGCFWHGCPKHSSPAKWLEKSSMAGQTEKRSQNSESRIRKSESRSGKFFWWKKMVANMARDRFVNRTLQRQGWTVLRIWEHDLTKNPVRCLTRIRHALQIHF